MKNLLLFFTVVFCGTLTSQVSLEPYVESKSGGFQNYETVKVGFFNTLKGKTKDGNKTKVKTKDLVVALAGKTEGYKSFKHRQVVAFGIKSDNLFSRTGTKVTGRSLFEVVMKSGDNMLVCNKVNRGYWSNTYPGSQSVGGVRGGTATFNQTGGSSKQYYYVKGVEVTALIGTEFFNDAFIAELIESFGNCPELENVLNVYREKKGKLFRITPLFRDLKQIYLEKCFEQ